MEKDTGNYEQENAINELKVHLQFLSNGFSVDYKNKIQILYISLQGIIKNNTHFRLPCYEDYIQEKVEQFQGYYPKIDIKALYFEGVDTKKLAIFNEKISHINNMADSNKDISEIKKECDLLIREYLSEVIEDVSLDTLLALANALLK